jgi:exopolyphosphatase/guanosine-5'-triphosphate,3'-diphosphate pyrophosphatase
MILAGIDIGTNTIRLLVADAGPGSFREICSGRTITRLGQGLDRSGVISPEAQERSLAALAEFVDHARFHSASSIAAIGTSALRKASNAAAFISRVGEQLGIDVRVITGEEEARLTLLGVGRALREKRLGSAIVIDIGGGSTEVIRSRPSTGTKEVSLPLGAVYLSERFVHHDPPTAEETGAIRKAVREELERHRDMLSQDPLVTFVGTAGTVTTLAAMDQEMAEYDPEKINGYVLTRESLDRIVGKLTAAALGERRNMKGLEPGREDIILAGALVAQEIMDQCGSPEMLVSDWGLREGIVLDLYENLRKGNHQITNSK